MSEKRKSLFERGYKVAKRKAEEFEEKRKNFVYRFWMPVEGESKIVFLDDDPVIIEEHQLKINGNWNNFFTCLKMFDERCPICKQKDNPSTVGYYTIIDRTVWSDKKGIVHKNERKLFGAKTKTLRKLRRLSNDNNGLVGCEFKVNRDGRDDPSVGSEFTLIKKHDIEFLKSKGLETDAFDYDVILAPKSEDELEDAGLSNEKESDNFSKKSVKIEEDQDDDVDF